jgi:hypothetical protein
LISIVVVYVARPNSRIATPEKTKPRRWPQDDGRPAGVAPAGCDVCDVPACVDTWLAKSGGGVEIIGHDPEPGTARQQADRRLGRRVGRGMPAKGGADHRRMDVGPAHADVGEGPIAQAREAAPVGAARCAAPPPGVEQLSQLPQRAHPTTAIAVGRHLTSLRPRVSRPLPARFSRRRRPWRTDARSTDSRSAFQLDVGSGVELFRLFQVPLAAAIRQACRVQLGSASATKASATVAGSGSFCGSSPG